MMQTLSFRGGVVLVLAFVTVLAADAQTFDGDFVLQQPGETVSLRLSENESGEITGTLSGQHGSYQIQAQRQDEVMVGTVLGGFAEARSCRGSFDPDGRLLLALFPRGASGQPVYQFAQRLLFRPSASVPDSSAAEATPKP